MRHCTLKKNLARRTYPIRHRYNYFWNSIYVMGMSEGTKKILTRRACSIRHCTPKKFLARRAYPIRHRYNYGLGKLFLELNIRHGYV